MTANFLNRNCGGPKKIAHFSGIEIKLPTQNPIPSKKLSSRREREIKTFSDEGKLRFLSMTDLP